MDLVMMVNNNIYSDVNFANLTSPIHRIADLIGYIVSNVSGSLEFCVDHLEARLEAR